MEYRNPRVPKNEAIFGAVIFKVFLELVFRDCFKFKLSLFLSYMASLAIRGPKFVGKAYSGIVLSLLK